MKDQRVGFRESEETMGGRSPVLITSCNTLSYDLIL
jgi:hypothetical protein